MSPSNILLSAWWPLAEKAWNIFATWRKQTATGSVPKFRVCATVCSGIGPWRLDDPQHRPSMGGWDGDSSCKGSSLRSSFGWSNRSMRRIPCGSELFPSSSTNISPQQLSGHPDVVSAGQLLKQIHLNQL